MTWEKYYTRKYNIQRHEVLLRAFETEFFKQFNPNFKILIVPEAGNEVFHYEKEKWQKCVSRMKQIVLNDYKTFYNLFEQEGNQFVQRCKDIHKKQLNTATNNELSTQYKTFYKSYLSFFATSIWVPFILGPEIDNEVKKMLTKIVPQNKLQEYTEASLSPEEDNIAMRERKDLLNIKDEKGLVNHWEKYKWIPCYDIDDEAWPIEHFKKEWKGIHNPQQELEKIENASQRKEKAYMELSKKINESNSDKNKSCKKKNNEEDSKDSDYDDNTNKTKTTMLALARRHAYIKDKRDEQRREGQFYIKSLFEEIGKRSNLTLKEVTYLTKEEILSLLDGNSIDKEDIQERTQGYVYMWHKGNHHIYSGKKAKEVMDQELPTKTVEQQEIKGICASVGNVQGRVKVITNTKGLNKVEKGDILVAISTHPDYVPAMGKAKAVITDEGGLTSHAAIVCRELGIPCLVGTKVGTKILKDGMEIELNTDLQRIKILNRRTD